LSQQLLPFGRSGDGLELLTFGVEQFLVLSVLCRRSARAWRTVRGLGCSSRVLRVLAHLRFRSVVVSSFVWARFRTVRVCRADSPRVPAPRGRSVIRGRYWRFCLLFGQSAAQGRTDRGVGADSPRQQAGQSAWPVRTVRPSWLDGPPEPG
jgi:hypothetical protein